MMDLLRQFFSFDKLMKDRLVAAFFFLGLVVIALNFLRMIGGGFGYMDDAFFGGLGLLLFAIFFNLLLFVGLRLACELAIAVFHINNNLSPDGGKSETAELDPVETAREIAQRAARTASDRTKDVVDKTRSRFSDDEDENVEEVYPDYEDPTPPKRTRKKSATTTKKTTAKKTTTAKKPAAKKTTTKKTTTKK